MGFHRTIAHIDLQALQNNLALIKQFSPQSKILAMVKSNAYGHNSVKISQTLQECVDVLGVSCLQEALELFSHQIKARIVIWGGFLNELELKTISEMGFETVVHNFEEIRILEETKLKKPIRVWLKIDTGMNRLGFLANQFHEANQRLIKNSNVTKPLFYMTHFSDADDLKKRKTLQQIAHFKALTDSCRGEKGLANSAAIINYPDSHHDWIRPGLILYGISLTDHESISQFGFKSVMTLTSTLIAIKEIKKGESVGYASSWKSPKKTRLGIISIGYGDGYPWHIREFTPVLIRSQICPIVGRVAMDYIACDLSDAPMASVADSVTMWGEDLPVETIAKKASTSCYELTCQLTSRVHFKYVNPQPKNP